MFWIQHMPQPQKKDRNLFLYNRKYLPYDIVKPSCVIESQIIGKNSLSLTVISGSYFLPTEEQSIMRKIMVRISRKQ